MVLKGRLIIIHRKILCYISLFFLFINSSYSQTGLPKRAELKTIIYSEYKIIGVVKKRQFVEGKIVTIMSLKTQDTIISGRYSKYNNNAYIEGIWKIHTHKGITHANGLFEVSNNEIGLTTIFKKSDSLQIKTEYIFYYQGFRNKYPAVLKKLPGFNYSSNYSLKVDYKDKSRVEKDRVIKLELNVDKSLIKKYGFYSIDDFIYYTPDIKQTYTDGSIFIGKVENTSRDSNNVINFTRKEGKWLFASGNIVFEELTQYSDRAFLLKIKYTSKQKVNSIVEMELIINKNLIDKYGYWATDEFVNNTPQVKMTWKNGDVFTGKVENTRDSSSVTQKLTIGEYEFVTGEVFRGNLSGEYRRGIPVSGIMNFTDGTFEKGDWVAEYYIANNEWDEQVAPLKNLTEQHKLTIRLHKEIIEKQKELAYRKRILSKYGKYWGRLIFKNEFTLGMTKEMVLEFTSDKYYKISKVIFNGLLVETWRFDKRKMSLEILKEKGKEGAQVLMGLSFAESLGFGMESVPTLIFTDGKISGIFQH